MLTVPAAVLMQSLLSLSTSSPNQARHCSLEMMCTSANLRSGLIVVESANSIFSFKCNFNQLGLDQFGKRFSFDRNLLALN